MTQKKTFALSGGLGFHLPSVNLIVIAPEVPIWVSSRVETALRQQQSELSSGRGWYTNVVESTGSELRA